MLPGFEDMNPHLKEEEEDIIKEMIVPHLKRKVGKENAVTGKRMREGILKVYGVKLTEAKMRRAIQYIRVHNLIPKLCSCQKGQFVAETDKVEGINEKENSRTTIYFSLR